jgi:DNA-binding transcriptional regulator YiaG
MISMTADEIRELRRRLAMTQQQFSNKLGVSMSTVQKWEAETSKPRGLSRRALRKLARKAPKEDTRLPAPDAAGPADLGSEPPTQT